MKHSILIIILVFVCSIISISSAQAHPSWAIAVDSRNQIYVSDLEKIWKIDADGKVSIFNDRHTHELTLDAEDNLLGENLNYNPATQKFTAALWRITPRGDFSYILTPTETAPKGSSVWKNQAGATYYFGQTEIEPREFYLLKRNLNGSIKVLFGNEKKALAQRQVVPYSSAGMTFGIDGALYFKNADTIWKATPDDKISIVVERHQLESVAPQPMLFGLAVDQENNIFTADFNGKIVLKIAKNKQVSVYYRADKEWTPTGVYSRSGNLFVLENKNLPPNAKPIVRVQKVAADGQISTVGTVGSNQENSSANSNAQNSPLSVNNQNSIVESKSCLGIGLLSIACAGLLFRHN